MVEGTEAVSRGQYEEIMRSKRPHALAAIGFVGLLVLAWLMIFKPALGLGGDACVKDRPIGRTVQLCASNDQAFHTSSLTAVSGAPIGLIFENEDDGVPHNVAIYADDSAEESLFVGETIVGPERITYDVPAIDAGEYYFRCDVHPIMDGTLEVT
jgi:plastocyanin